MGEKHHNFMKKGSKSGLLKTFGANLGFYTKNSPRNSWSPHFMIALWNQKSRNAGTSCSTFRMFVHWNAIRHKQNWHNKTLKVSYNLAFVLSTIIMASESSQHQFSINWMMIHLRGAIITMDLPFSPFNINRLDTNKYRYVPYFLI